MKNDLNFILYNNRSIKLVFNFIKKLKINAVFIFKIDNYIEKLNTKFNNDSKKIKLKKSSLNFDKADLIYTPDELNSCINLVKDSILNLYKYADEVEWLYNRGITDEFIKINKLGSLSYIIDNATKTELDILGISCHPYLSDLLNDDLSGGGIILPLFNDSGDTLENVTVRRISDIGKLKYTQSCPDISIYGDLSGDEIWITEGIFDTYALILNGEKSVSVSSAMWSSIQLSILLEQKRKIYNIFVDDDKVGYKTALILSYIIKEFNSESVVNFYKSNVANDAAEHFLEKNMSTCDLCKIDIDINIINNIEETEFDFLEYLKKRKF